MTDNMETLLSSGTPAVKSLEITAEVVSNKIYKNDSFEAPPTKLRSGSSISEDFKYPEIPLMVVQMIRTGGETGKLTFMLKTLGRFYKKEVDNAVDTLVGLIEPVMIVAFGRGGRLLLISILGGPIYNITAGM